MLFQWPLKALYNMASPSPIHAHIHTPTAVSAMQGNSQLVRNSQGEVFAQGHLDPQLGGAGDRTSNLTVTSNPLFLVSDMPPYVLPTIIVIIISVLHSADATFTHK